MNDPGLESTIQDGAKAVEEDKHDEEGLEEEDEQTFLNPSRWWFASTAFPLLAGTFGPMASAFSVCALVENWKVVVPLGGNEAHGIDQEDPKWLIAINAVSLVLALVANLALLLNMARRLSFPVAQPITIIGWYIASILLIALVTTSVHTLKVPGENRALTQAFYYAIIAAVLYFLIASLMCVTVYGAYRDHYPKEFRLSASQRTLMLQTISFMVYMVGGGAVYAKIEGWNFLDAVFFANYTLLTVGIGYYAPLTHLGRGLLFPYAIGGIIILGLVVGSIRSLVLERGKEKLGSRMIEKKREALLKDMLKKDDMNRLDPLTGNSQRTKGGLTERQRREEEFLLMRKIQERASVRQKWTALVISGSAWLVLWLLGAVVFWKAEHAQEWSYFQSLYFAYVSLLTIGYGDFKLFSNSGKPFFVFWSLLAVPTLTIVISNMGDTIVKGVRDLTIYLGEFTLLPGDVGVRERLKQLASKIRNDTIVSRGKACIKDQTPISSKKEYHADEENVNDIENEHEKPKRVGNVEKSVHDLKKNMHEYHYLLVKEVRNVMKHLHENPQRQYSYEEWTWFLKLMGQDEASAKSHRKAPIVVDKRKDERPDTQQAQTDENDQSSHPWSWLGNRSPLMGEMEEARWVLDRLSSTLERSLRKQSSSQKGVQGDKVIP